MTETNRRPRRFPVRVRKFKAEGWATWSLPPMLCGILVPDHDGRMHGRHPSFIQVPTGRNVVNKGTLDYSKQINLFISNWRLVIRFQHSFSRLSKLHPRRNGCQRLTLPFHSTFRAFAIATQAANPNSRDAMPPAVNNNHRSPDSSTVVARTGDTTPTRVLFPKTPTLTKKFCKEFETVVINLPQSLRKSLACSYKYTHPHSNKWPITSTHASCPYQIIPHIPSSRRNLN